MQYYGKPSEHMVRVPLAVKRWAERAFEMRERGFKGATETGWKRAEQLSTQSHVPLEDVRYMRNWFARHKRASYPTFKAWREVGGPATAEWFRRRGALAWVTWGADAGYKWVNTKSVVARLNKVYGTTYTCERL